jgi:hypothetical protein
MHVATFHLKSVSGSPYQQGRHHQTPKLHDRELADDYEERTWMQKLHVTDEGFVEIPPVAIRAGLADTAKFLGMQIPGKSRQTYTKHFESGIMIIDPIVLPIRADDPAIEKRGVFGDARGQRRGRNPRVTKYFPTILAWEATLIIYVLDAIITKPVLVDHLRACGQFIGVGVYRAQNGGSYGQFSAELLDWSEVAL